MPGETSLLQLLTEAKSLAKRYYALTGRPLGVTGEVAEFEAVRLLGLDLADVHQAGWDATATTPDARLERFQIKGRCLTGKYKPGAKLGKIKLNNEWDAVLLVMLNSDFEATEIYRAERAAVETALTAPGSRARNERGQLSLAKFRSIGRKIWPAKGRDA